MLRSLVRLSQLFRLSFSLFAKEHQNLSGLDLTQVRYQLMGVPQSPILNSNQTARIRRFRTLLNDVHLRSNPLKHRFRIQGSLRVKARVVYQIPSQRPIQRCPGPNAVRSKTSNSIKTSSTRRFQKVVSRLAVLSLIRNPCAVSLNRRYALGFAACCAKNHIHQLIDVLHAHLIPWC
jgi:hypothetical protein